MRIFSTLAGGAAVPAALLAGSVVGPAYAQDLVCRAAQKLFRAFQDGLSAAVVFHLNAGSELEHELFLLDRQKAQLHRVCLVRPIGLFRFTDAGDDVHRRLQHRRHELLVGALGELPCVSPFRRRSDVQAATLSGPLVRDGVDDQDLDTGFLELADIPQHFRGQERSCEISFEKTCQDKSSQPDWGKGYGNR